jgi:hypothetical protein
MRASVRRIDLTTDPAGVEFWPSLDWLADDAPAVDSFTGPHGRTGLWDAMAQAVQRVREVSLANANGGDAQIIEFAPDAPHLAYLARVACSTDGDDDRNHLPGADVIAMVDLRAREGR